ncbi:hypothetical protein BTVI_65127 [Pitangus sulphuratus]|nr:hypothetical protein BTVI_65127 [Pitangus sulphuratus]
MEMEWHVALAQQPLLTREAPSWDSRLLQVLKHITVGINVIILICHSGRPKDLPQDKKQITHGDEMRTVS